MNLNSLPQLSDHRSQHASIELVLRSQNRLESAIDDIKHGIDALPEALRLMLAPLYGLGGGRVSDSMQRVSSGGDAMAAAMSWKDEFRLRAHSSDKFTDGARSRVSSSGFVYDEAQRCTTRPRLPSLAGSITNTGSLMTSLKPLEVYER
eukprot:2122287-Amphidinium_carterae.1